MLTIDVSHDMKKIAEQINLQARLAFPASRAINKTLGDLREHLDGEINSKIDNPTPWTQKFFHGVKSFRPSRYKENPISGYIRGAYLDTNKVGKTKEFTIGHQFVQAATRNPSGLETLLRRKGMLGGGEYLIPAAGMRKDKYGNVSRGQIAQILAQLKAFSDTYQWSTRSKRSVDNAAKAGRVFWADGKRGLRKGIWIEKPPTASKQKAAAKAGKRARGQLMPLYLVIGMPRYTPRVDLKQIGDNFVRRVLPLHFDQQARNQLDENKRREITRQMVQGN